MFSMETNQFGYALAKAVDDYLESVAEADTGSISDLGADNTFPSALIRTVMASLMGADVPFDVNMALRSEVQVQSVATLMEMKQATCITEVLLLLQGQWM